MRVIRRGLRALCQDCQAPKFSPPRVLNQCLGHKNLLQAWSPPPSSPPTACLCTVPLRILRPQGPHSLETASHQSLVDSFFCPVVRYPRNQYKNSRAEGLILETWLRKEAEWSQYHLEIHAPYLMFWESVWRGLVFLQVVLHVGATGELCYVLLDWQIWL